MSRSLASQRFPYLPIGLRVTQSEYRLEALIDTGFAGAVAVPGNFINSSVGPDWQVECQLADGSEITALVYRGWLELEGLAGFSVRVLALGDEPIIGRGVIDRFLVTLDHGREVRIEL